MDALARLKAVLGAVDDPPERTFAGLVLRQRLPGAPPVVPGPPTRSLDEPPPDERQLLAENYREMLTLAFGDVYPEPADDARFQRTRDRDPAGWRWCGQGLVDWLSPRLPPPEGLAVVETHAGLLGGRRGVRVGTVPGWRLPDGDRPALGDYLLGDGTCVRCAGGAPEVDRDVPGRALGLEDLERLARWAGMPWVDAF